MNDTMARKPKKDWTIGIILYLLALLLFATWSIGAMSLGWLPLPYSPLRVPLMCGAIAYVGGALYCFRAIYLNKCVYKRWNSDWHVWYFIRPITSTISGAVSYLFLKAGLLVLESSSNANASEIGFFALAFIAGFNVDKFVDKIEDVARAVWGIEKSRSAQARAGERTPDTQADSSVGTSGPRIYCAQARVRVPPRGGGRSTRSARMAWSTQQGT